MPYIKINYGSSRNISVQGSDYVEVDASDLRFDGSVSGDVLDAVWQEAVNEYMMDTYVELVENEGD